MNYSELKTAVADYVKDRTGLATIDGDGLQQVILAIIDSVGAGYMFMGVADPVNTNPGTPDQRVWYLACTAGTYGNFDSIVLNQYEMAVLKWDTSWHKETLPDIPSKTQIDARLAAQDSRLDGQDADIAAQDAIIAAFKAAIQNQIDNYPNITINGDVTNAPDGEDLTSVNQGGTDVLKFANRPAVEGMGYIILRKGSSLASQLTQTNTIYEIRYDFDLNGGSVTIPSGCVLRFNGGSLSNGTLVGDDTIIDAPDVPIFETSVFRYRGYVLDGIEGVAAQPVSDNLYVDGTWANDYVSPAWIGLDVIDEAEDCAPLLRAYITLHRTGCDISLPTRTYGIYTSVNINAMVFDGNFSIFKYCDLSAIYDGSIPLPAGASALDFTYFKRGLPLTYQCIWVSGEGGEIRNFTIDQSNVTNADIDLNNQWGVYGLVGKGGSAKNVIKNISILNAFECGLLGIQGETIIQNCYFSGSGEHLVYGNVTKGGDLTFEDCTFTNWENNATIAAARGEAYAIKCKAFGTSDYKLTISNCKFIRGNTLSHYSVQAEYDEVYFNNCTFEEPQCTILCREDKYLNVYVDRCIGIPVVGKAYGIWHISNSRGRYTCLQSAYKIDNCILEDGYVGSSIDARKDCPVSMIATVRNLYVQNTIFKFLEGNSTEINLTGVYNAQFADCRFEYSGASGGDDKFSFDIRPNTADTDPSTTLTIGFNGCEFRLGKRDRKVIGARLYDVSLLNTTIYGERYVDGYRGRLYFLSVAKSLMIDNVVVNPGKDGTVLSLYDASIPISYHSNYYFGNNAASNAGLYEYNMSGKIPRWYNGSGWTTADGLPSDIRHSGTFSQKPTVSGYGVPVGFGYFCTDKQTAEGATNGIMIFHKGSDVWVDALGRTIS